MSEQSFASLNPSLLARKGGAKPAMRPQVAAIQDGGAAAQNLDDLGWNDMGDMPKADNDSKVLQLTPEPANPEAEAEAHRNDELAEADLAHAAAEKPVVVEQQELLVKKLAIQPVQDETIEEKPAEEVVEDIRAEVSAEVSADVRVDSPAKFSAPPRRRRSALERGKRAAFTLRLDAERHLKLRLACTLRGKSAQQLVTDALDSLLDEMSDVKQLAAQANTNE